MSTSYQNNFIQGLSKNEIKIIEEHLKKSSTISEENKDLKLFQVLTNNSEKVFHEQELSEIIGSKGSALRALKSRLFDKATEALTHETYIQDDELFSKNDRVVFMLRKKFLVYKILFHTSRKDSSQILLEILNQIINKAKEYEIIDVLREALIAKKYFYGIRSGMKEFNKLNSEINFYNYYINALYFATDCFYQVIINNDLKGTFSQKQLKSYLVVSIKQIKLHYDKTKSQQINYYLHILQFALAEQQKNYIKAIHYCKKIIALVKKSNVLYRKERMGMAHINLSQYYSFIKKYDASRTNLKIAQTYYLANTLNYFVSIELEFFINLYDIKFETAELCIYKLFNHPIIDSGEFRKSKYIYYHSALLFAQKKFKESYKLLNKSLEIEKDKSRWNISLKIMNIMLCIELNKIDEASRKLETLRKYVQRHEKSSEIKQRDVLIVKTLRELEKDGFNYNGNNKVAAKMLKELALKNKPSSWEHYSPELIPFHEWLGH